MKRVLILTIPAILCGVLFSLCLSSCKNNSTQEEIAVRGVLERTFGHVPSNVKFVSVESSDSCDFYALSVSDNTLIVEGSSVVALCKGFHDYILEKGYGIASWSGNRLEFPSHLEPMDRTVNRSPFEHHLFFNVCTFGYTAPFWDWDRWQKEIDWLALHGFDMPLAPIGYEAVARRVFLELGLDEDQVAQYFCGPAHMPWSRMGNLSGIDGNMPQIWYDEQIELGHKIISRMRELGMDPVIQGFAGFVPDAVTELCPGRDFTRTEWHGLGATYLSPVDSLCRVLSTSFVREWEHEFGKCDYYLIDSFNEMELPFAPIGNPSRYEDLHRYASAIYDSLHEASPDAVWVMQGWMFGRNRDIWEPRSVQALLNAAPKGKLMVVDLAVDYNEFVWKNGNSWDVFDGFFGTDWIWSTTPNFGGRNTMKGVLDFYLNGHLEALSSSNKGFLRGYGCSPEGVEVNEPLFECVSSAGWSSSAKDVKDFLMKYSHARYGRDLDGISEFWDGMLESVYGSFCSNDVLQWQRSPAHHNHNALNINEHFFNAIESFFKDAGTFDGNEIYRSDAVYYGAMYLAMKAEILFHNVVAEIGSGNDASLRTMQNQVVELLLEADRLLESHPLYRLQRWQDYARSAATDSLLGESFEREARHLITSWGGDGIYDYSSRVWAGMIRDYYVPRLQLFFDAVADGRYVDLRAWSNEFHSRNEISKCVPHTDPVAASAALVKGYASLQVADPKPYREFWCSQDFPGLDQVLVDCYVLDTDIKGLKSLRFTASNGNPVVENVVIRNRLDGQRYFYPHAKLQPGKPVDVVVNIPESGLPGMGNTVYVFVTFSNAQGTRGSVDFVY